MLDIEETKPIHLKPAQIFKTLATITALMSVVTFAQHGAQIPWRRLETNAPIKFLFVNDIHYDPLYVSTGIPSDNKCRQSVKNPNTTYLFGQYGCDSPVSIINSFSLNWPSIETPDFIIFGGDLPAHELHEDINELVEMWTDVMSLLKQTHPNTPIYPVLGNHDLVPDWGSPSTDLDNFDKLSRVMDSLNDEELATFKRGGYYFHDFGDIRIVFMNTNLYAVQREEIADEDPCGQLSWLDEVLSAEKPTGIVMHIPPGMTKIGNSEGWYKKYADKFQEILSRHEVKFIWSGHTHIDHFMPIGNQRNIYVMGTPALSPDAGNNPGFRVYDVTTQGVVDYRQYYVDIFMNPHAKLDWKLEYQFTEAYHVPDASHESLAVAVDFIQNDSEGRWGYRERLYARAMQDGAFWHCVMSSMTNDELGQCEKTLAIDVKQN